MTYFQNYNPTENVYLSTFLAALPIIVLLYLLALHPHKDKQGHRQLGIFAPYAAILATLVAFCIVTLVMKMPPSIAASSFLFGFFTSGVFPIGWIVFTAIFLYNITVVTGQFEVLKDSIAGITDDRRLQALIIAFSFGAFMEGTSGFGTPVAVCGAIMVGLGFRPMTAAVICLIANTSPVAFGAVGTPIITLSAASGIPEHYLTMMAGRQLVLFSIIVPFWLVATLVFMDKGSWKDVWDVWPATLVCGASFALAQFIFSQMGWTGVINITAGIFSMILTILFLRVWKPKHIMGHADSADNQSKLSETGKFAKHTISEYIKAWTPWALLGSTVFIIGLNSVKTTLNNLFCPTFNWPYLHNLVYHTPPVGSGDTPMAAVFKFNFLTMAGTGILLAALISGFFVLKLSSSQWKAAFSMTISRMKVPLSVICTVLGFGFMTRYSGTDAVLGLAFTKTGAAYPFFASMLGWLGVFLTGSDASSNAMFGNLQRITAEQLGLNPVLIVTANSTGGVMGKIINAQSMVVATVACYKNHHEGMAAVGPIFRAVFWHSLILGILISTFVWAQAYVFPWMQVWMP